MICRVFTWVVVLGWLAGCSQQGGKGPVPAAQLPASAKGAPSALGNMPKDARLTIMCQICAGPARIGEANRLKEYLLATTKLRDWYVVHGEQDSTLYYGFYRSTNKEADPKEYRRAMRDKQSVAEVKSPTGEPLFPLAMFVPLDVSSPQAPPEWDLNNAKGFWSLEIAAYVDDPMRKQAAVDAVGEARKMGIEAYFYHGETASSVCIGAWPEEAVKEQETDMSAARDAAGSVLVSNTPLPEEWIPRNTGGPITVLQPVVEPLDARLIAALRQYPFHAVNGYYTHAKTDATGNVIWADPSFLVKLPHAVYSKSRESQPSSNDAPNSAYVVPPSILSGQSPQGGKLKSVGGK
jgi:hypothetical protein